MNRHEIFQDRKDMVKALENALSPLISQFGKDESLILPCITGAHYNYTGAGVEKVLRPFWGIVPALAGGENSTIINTYVTMATQKLLEGLDKESPLYIGSLADFDQKLVEMCIVGLSLILAPSAFRENLKKEDQKKITQWLAEVNSYDYPKNNWRFFRIFCNLGLVTCSTEGSQEQIDQDLQLIDSFYKGDGWYSDGETEQYDYYISFAMHFYGLIYAKTQQEVDPQRAKQFKQRAALFAKDFLGWFAPTGEALPFGRSQTYRFAQSAFWASAAFADLDKEVPWLDMGVIKGLLLRNLRWWYSQPIFDEGGVLSIGYAYPNLIMAENYNAPGSPYWAFKSFLVLALEEDHPFWKVQEKPYPKEMLPKISLQKHPRFLFSPSPSGDVRVLNGGQFADFDPRHTEQKYGKLSYSTLFGFSVPTGSRKIPEQAGDNTLMVKSDGELWIHRGRTKNHLFYDEVIASDWYPKDGVLIRSILTWINDWEIRLHFIRSDKTLEFIEGGTACPLDKRSPNIQETRDIRRVEGSGLWSEIDFFDTGDQNKNHSEYCFVIGIDPNTNLLYPRTSLPAIRRIQSPGTTLWGTISSAGRISERTQKIEPKLNMDGDCIAIQASGVTRIFPKAWLSFD